MSEGSVDMDNGEGQCFRTLETTFACRWEGVRLAQTFWKLPGRFQSFLEGAKEDPSITFWASPIVPENRLPLEDDSF